MKLFQFTGLGLAAALTISAPVSAQDLAPPKTGPWHSNVEVTDDGHVIGDPDAETVLTEFVSYTCGHCATFAKQGDPALDIAFISSGKLRFEVRSFIRNALDLTVSMMVACGAPKKFKGNHAMFMRSQDDWLQRAMNAPQSQQAAWGRGDRAARISMANSLGLIDKMTKQRGYTLPEVNACLGDDTKAQQLMVGTQNAAADYQISGTPSFALNGETLPQVHSWQSLYPALKVHFAALDEADSEPQLGESQFNP